MNGRQYKSHKPVLFGSQLSWRIAFWSFLACVAVAFCVAFFDFREARKQLEQSTESSLKIAAAIFKPLLIQSLANGDKTLTQQQIASLSIYPSVTYVSLSIADGGRFRIGQVPIDNQGIVVEEPIIYNDAQSASSLSSLTLMHDFSKNQAQLQDYLFNQFSKYFLFAFAVWLTVYLLYRFLVLRRILLLKEYLGDVSAIEQNLADKDRVFDDLIASPVIDEIDELTYAIHRLWKTGHTAIKSRDLLTADNDHKSLMDEIERLKAVLAEQNEALNIHSAVLNAMPFYVFWKDTNLNVMGANQAFLDEMGAESIEDVKGRRDEDFVWAKNADLYHADDRVILQTKERQCDYEERIPTQDGKEIIIVTIKAPIIDADGKVLGILSLYREKPSLNTQQQE